jgi:hypothetical protein
MKTLTATVATLALGTAAALAEPALIYDLGGKFDKSFNEAAFNRGRALYDGELLGRPFRSVAKTFQVRVWCELCRQWRELNPAARGALLACFEAFAGRFLAGVDWEPAARAAARVAALLPGLMLARVDGKSPVEYLSEQDDLDRVRRVASRLLREPVATPSEVAEAWRAELGA